jgi:hypothetical protein
MAEELRDPVKDLDDIAECLNECAKALRNRGGMLAMDLAKEAAKKASLAKGMANQLRETVN